MIGSATCATAEATRRHVETTPTTGANGRIFSTKSGKYFLVAIPVTGLGIICISCISYCNTHK